MQHLEGRSRKGISYGQSISLNGFKNYNDVNLFLLLFSLLISTACISSLLHDLITLKRFSRFSVFFIFLKKSPIFYLHSPPSNNHFCFHISNYFFEFRNISQICVNLHKFYYNKYYNFILYIFKEFMKLTLKYNYLY